MRINDGYNDAITGTVNPAIPSAHWYYRQIKTRFESSGLSWRVFAGRSHLMDLLMSVSNHLRSQNPSATPPDEMTSRAGATLENYLSNVELARALAKEYGFQVRFFWHPILYYGNKPLGPFEAMASKLAPAAQPPVRAVYRDASRHAAESMEFVFLGRVFDRSVDSIYIDPVHLGPRGNEMIADAIAKELLPLLHPPANGSTAPKK